MDRREAMLELRYGARRLDDADLGGLLEALDALVTRHNGVDGAALATWAWEAQARR